MKYPRLYKSLDEFERMELRNRSGDWSAGEFFQEVLEEPFVDDLWEEDDEDEDY
jgi:hypothetical protein